MALFKRAINIDGRQPPVPAGTVDQRKDVPLDSIELSDNAGLRSSAAGVETANPNSPPSRREAGSA